MNTQESMRVFIAVELPEFIKQHLYTMQKTVREASRSGKFTKHDNFHLTLRFIGEAGPESRHVLKQAISAAASRITPFQISLQGLGRFQRGSRHIIWVGITASPQLNKMYSCLQEELAAKGIPREGRAYTPHITLGREIALKHDFSNIAAAIPNENPIIPVERISLMQSIRIDGDLRYIPIFSRELSKV